MEFPQVVCGTSRAKDKHTFLPERPQRLAQVVVIGTIPIRLYRELANGNVSLGVHQHEGNPRPVVEPPLRVLVDALEAARGKQLLHPLCQLWGTRRWVLELVFDLKQNI